MAVKSTTAEPDKEQAGATSTCRQIDTAALLTAGSSLHQQYYHPRNLLSGNAVRALLRDNRQLWDLYTLRDDRSGQPEGGCKSDYTGTNPGSLMEPVVSEYLYGSGPAIEYQDGKKFAVCLTHDVDVVYPPLAHRAFSSFHYLKRGDMGSLMKEALWRKGGKGCYDYRTFREIMRLEDRYDAKSSFYFLAAERNNQRLRKYNVEDLAGDLGCIIDSGREVGLHGGYYAYDDLETIKTEKRRLEKALGRSVCGYRNHYLRFQVPETWEYLSQAGFKYDTTLGYNNVPGFRNGMCHPFRPCIPGSGREVDIWEIPLAIMERALFDYAKTFDEAWAVARRLIDTTERNRGVITLLWHNEVFRAPFRAQWMALYDRILKYCQEKGAWMTSGEEISRLCDIYVR